MLTVTINRRRWQRGEGADKSSLFNGATKKKCCIGFLAQALGATLADIRDKRVLTDLTEKEGNQLRCRKFADWHDAQVCLAYITNDDRTLSEKTRMTRLKEIGKKMGVNFVFSQEGGKL